MTLGNYNVTGDTHRACFFILPAMFHVEHRCADPECGTLHGWSFEMGWFWWSIVIEKQYPGGEVI
jgi:hypothetical protein